MPDTKSVVAMVIFGLLVLCSWVFVVPVWWRGRNRWWQHVMFRAWIFLSPPAQRGMYRALLVTTICGSMMAAGALMGMMRDSLGVQQSEAYLTVAAVLGLGGLVLGVVAVSVVVLFNRPKFLVAPHTRNQIGLARIWKRSITLAVARRRARKHASRQDVRSSGFDLP